MQRTLKSVLCLMVTGGLGLAAGTARAAEVEIDSNTFGGLEARSIGPAVMSGRIAAIDAVAARPAHHLRRRGERRRLEVDGRRHDLQAGLRRAHPVDRRHRHRPQGPEDRLGGHRRVVGAQQRLGRRRRLQDHRRRRHLAARGPREAPSASPASRSSPADGNTVWVCATGHLWNATRSAASSRPPTAARPGRRSSTSTPTPAAPTSPSTRRTRRILYAGMWQFRRTPDSFSLRRQGQRPLQVDRRRRDLAEAQDRPARGGEGAHRGRRGAVAAERGLRPGRVEGHRALPLGRPRRELAAGEQLVQRPGAAVLLRAPRGRSRRTTTRSTSRA